MVVISNTSSKNASFELKKHQINVVFVFCFFFCYFISFQQSFWGFLISILMDCICFETVLNDFVSKQVVTQNMFTSLVQGIAIKDL